MDRADRILLDRAEYRDRVLACWLGKTIGGTLGAPYETKKQVNTLTFFDPVPREPAPNDDLDLQLIWLQMMEERGAPPRLPWFAEYWRRHLSAYPWNEYGFCSRNLERGLVPPVSGWFENYYVDEMGSPIRSELWACIAPADPQRAAALAWMDSALDHAGGEGTHGEMFWAAVESAAFVERDPDVLIRIGLAQIPPACQIARVIREAVWCRRNGKTWAEARERINATYGHAQPCNAIPNHGFTILGWLYGADFGDRLCAAVNCGYDTDCTGATLGALLGILGGTAGIPAKWSDPVGTAIVLHPFTRTTRAPKTLAELADRTAIVAETMARRPEARAEFGDAARLPGDLRARLLRTEDAVTALEQDPRAAFAADGDLDLILHYGGDPVLWPGEERVMELRILKGAAPILAAAKLVAPGGWSVRALEGSVWPQFGVTAPAFPGAAQLTVEAQADGRFPKASFTVLSPDAAPGFPSAVNIATCSVCHGRQGACVCAPAAS